MLNKIVFFLATVIPALAIADARKYDVRATRMMKQEETCGASDRMMKDRHVIKIEDSGAIFIDDMQWQVESGEPDVVVTYHKKPGQFAYLMMEMYVNQRGLSGKYFLFGINSKREACFDVVYIDGTAR